MKTKFSKWKFVFLTLRSYQLQKLSKNAPHRKTSNPEGFPIFILRGAFQSQVFFYSFTYGSIVNLDENEILHLHRTT